MALKTPNNSIQSNDSRLGAAKAKVIKKRLSPSQRGLLGIAKVITVNYEESMVSLRIVMGTDFLNERVPVPIVFPGSGTRHFLGAMPEVGDMCVVGWMAQGSSAKETHTPLILGWIPKGDWLGHDWVFTSPFPEDEVDFTPKKQDETGGVYNQHRHKRMHMQPGDIVASSSKGSDILLNEGVYISNRRANEIRLRDQDQAFVVRSLQQFHVMAGTNIYGGLIQRDAGLIQSISHSDGVNRSQARQLKLNEEGVETVLPFKEMGSAQEGFRLNPKIKSGAAALPEQLKGFGPFGQRRDTNTVYGGRGFYRVGNSGGNAVLNASPSFTEYRVEVQNTAKATLPLTEQTENHVSVRTTPLVEIVYGTAVGNNPNESNYGDFLTTSIFPEANIETTSGGNIEDQIAVFGRVNCIDGGENVADRTFWSVHKNGTVKVYIGGKKDGNSFDLRVSGKTRLDFSGGLEFKTGGKISLEANDATDERKVGVEISSKTGGILITADGQIEDPVTTNIDILNPTGADGGTQPNASVKIEGEEIHLESGTGIRLNSAQVIQVEGKKEVNIFGSGVLNLKSPKGTITQDCDRFNHTVTGKAEMNFSGPGDGKNRNLPLRKVTLGTPKMDVAQKVVDEYQCHVGSREETFTLGHHETTMKIGNMTYNLWKGKHTISIAKGLNEAVLSPTGYSVNTMMAGASISMKASGGVTAYGTTGASLISPANIRLQAPSLAMATAGKKGPALCGSDQNPLNGQPYFSPSNGFMGNPSSQYV